MYKSKTGILKIKWLKELKLEKEFSKAIKFTKRNIGKY
jgi:hypothetical protein